ncbi:MAG: UMP kinase [FCB group bacterium]|nr:UMP kinase [FCB group bacterium]
MADKPAYKRILLKLSGEAFDADGTSGGINFGVVNQFCDELVKVHAMGVQIGLVIGGGNIIRGAHVSAETGLDQPTCDYMGMLATVINALALQGVLDKKGVSTRVLTAIEMRPVAEPYIRRRAIRHLEKGRVVIFGAGTGNPFFTTDTAAALRANEIHAEALFKATKVDGVYDKDPMKNPGAVKYDELNYTEILTRKLNVMDATAISLCRANNMRILIFNLLEPGSIMRALMGEAIGTVVRGD